MDRQTFDDRFSQTLATTTGIEGLDANTDERVSLSLDSLDVIDFVMRLEEAFNFDIPDDEIDWALDMTYGDMRETVWGVYNRDTCP